MVLTTDNALPSSNKIPPPNPPPPVDFSKPFPKDVSLALLSANDLIMTPPRPIAPRNIPQKPGASTDPPLPPSSPSPSGSIHKKRHVSSACMTCRKRKSKCDALKPSCTSCIRTGRQCVYNEEADQRRKGVLKREIGDLVDHVRSLEALISAMQSSSEEDSLDIWRRVRARQPVNEILEAIRGSSNPSEASPTGTYAPPPPHVRAHSTESGHSQESASGGSARPDGLTGRSESNASSLSFILNNEGHRTPGQPQPHPPPPAPPQRTQSGKSGESTSDDMAIE